MKRITLNWRFRFEDEALKNKACEKKIAWLEKKVQELGGNLDGQEDFTAEKKDRSVADEVEPMTAEDLESKAVEFNEEELRRMYKRTEASDKELRELRAVKQVLQTQIVELSRLLKHAVENKEHDDGEEETASTTAIQPKAGEEATGAEADPDVRPKVKPANLKKKFKSKSAQTDETGVDMEDSAIKGLRETISSLRAELKGCSDASDQLEALKNERSSEGARIIQLRKRLEEAAEQIQEKDFEIEYLLTAKQRQKERIDQQLAKMEQLNIQLNKNSIQEKFQVQVGDTRQAQMQASLGSTIVDLQKSIEEREKLQAEVEELRAQLSSHTRKPQPGVQELLDKALEDNRLLTTENSKMAISLESLTKEVASLESDLKKANEDLKEKEEDTDYLRKKSKDISERNDQHMAEKERLLIQVNNLLDQSASERNESQLVNENLATELKSCRKESEAHAAKVSELQSELESLSSKTAQIQSELDATSEKYNELLQDRSSSSDLLQKLQDRHSNEIQELEAERTGHLKKIDELEGSITQLKEDRQLLDDTLEKSDETNSSLKSEVDDLIAQCSEASDLKANLIAQHKEAIAELENTITKLQSEAEASNKLIDQLRSDISDHLAQQEHLQQESIQLKANTEELLKAQTSSDTLQQQYDSSLKITEELNAEKAKLLEAITEKESTIHQLSSQVSEQRAENEELKSQIEAMISQHTEVTHATELFNNSQLANEQLQRTIETTRAEVDTLNQAMVAQKNGYEQTTSTLTAELQTASAALKEFENEKQCLIDQASSQQTEIDNLSAQIVELQRELEQTRKDAMETSVSSQASSTAAEVMLLK